jgi:hypothetical protein
MGRLARLNPEASLVRWWSEPPRVGFLEYAFGKLRTLKEQQNLEVVVVAIPALDESNRDEWRLVRQIIQHESLKFGFQFVDVFRAFEKAGLRKLRNEPSDMVHPNPDGHAIIASEVYDHLVRSQLLPDVSDGAVGAR